MEPGWLAGVSAPRLDVEVWLQGTGKYHPERGTLLVSCEVWAPVCITELPKLGSREAEYAAVGIDVVGLTLVTKAATKERVATFLHDHRILFPFGKLSTPLVLDADREAWPTLQEGRGAVLLIRRMKIVWAGLLEHVPGPSSLGKL
jgi:hypothetical protein